MNFKTKKILLLTLLTFTNMYLFSQQKNVNEYKTGSNESKFEHFTFYSRALAEEREIMVYLPEYFDFEKHYNVIFCTDGQLINEQYKIKLDSLFRTKTIAPLIIIGVHSNEKQVPNSVNIEYRFYEYTENNKSNNPDIDSRFKRHLEFFVNEVNEFIKEKLDIKLKNRYFYGTSNGAAFGINMSKYYPDMFSKYLLYSTVGANYKNLKWKTKNYPFFIIRCGNTEPNIFIAASKKLSKYLSKKHYKHVFELYEGGHEREKWMNLFVKDIEKL